MKRLSCALFILVNLVLPPQAIHTAQVEPIQMPPQAPLPPASAINVANLCPGESTSLGWYVPVYWDQEKVDMLFAVDTTGSNGGVIATLANKWQSVIIPGLGSFISDPRFAVVDFKDYPFLPYGDPSDYPYRLRQGFTNQVDPIQTAFNALSASGGGDNPESYGRALYESYADPDLDWREDARRYVIMFGDSIPHDPDPGRDEITGTIDDLAMVDVLAGMKALSQPLLFNDVSNGVVSETWGVSASQTGSAADVIASPPDSADTTIIALVEYANHHLDRLSVQTVPITLSSWVATTPVSYTNLVLGDSKQYKSFTIEISVPLTATRNQDYDFTFNGVGDHYPFATITEKVHVGLCPVSTTTRLVSSLNPSHAGEEVTFTATVTSTSGVPDGTVSFVVDGGPLSGCTGVSLDGSGQAACHTSALTSGAHSISADYSGSASFTPSSAILPGGQVVIDKPPAGLRAANDGPTLFGMATYFTATLEAGSNAAYTWNFGDGQTSFGSNPGHLYGSVGQFTAVVTATNSAGRLVTDTLVTVHAATFTGLISKPNPSRLGQQVALTATITSNAGSPPGLLTFYANSVVIPGCSSLVLDGSGRAACRTYSFVRGTTPVTARYSGPVGFDPSLGVLAGGQVVNDVPPGGLQAASSAPTLFGQPTFFTATLDAGTNLIYAWNFGDDGTGEGPRPFHTYSSIGHYTAIVTATNPAGQQAVAIPVSINPAVADLDLDQSSVFLPGGEISFTLTLSNRGPHDAVDILLLDYLPASVEGDVWSWSCTGFTSCDQYNGSGPILSVLIGSLPHGKAMTFTVVGMLADPWRWVNTARLSISINNLDPDMSNNETSIGHYRTCLPIITVSP